MSKVDTDSLEHFHETSDAAEKAQMLMKAVCAFAFDDKKHVFYKARAFGDELVAAMFTTLGREDAQKIVTGMQEQLAFFKED